MMIIIYILIFLTLYFCCSFRFVINIVSLPPCTPPHPPRRHSSIVFGSGDAGGGDY